MADHRTNQIIAYTIFFIGIFMIVTGLVCWVKWNCNERILQRGLDRPKQLTFSQQIFQAIHNWDIFLPTCLMINGFILAVIAISLYLFG